MLRVASPSSTSSSTTTTTSNNTNTNKQQQLSNDPYESIRRKIQKMDQQYRKLHGLPPSPTASRLTYNKQNQLPLNSYLKNSQINNRPQSPQQQQVNQFYMGATAASSNSNKLGMTNATNTHQHVFHHHNSISSSSNRDGISLSHSRISNNSKTSTNNATTTPTTLTTPTTTTASPSATLNKLINDSHHLNNKSPLKQPSQQSQSQSQSQQSQLQYNKLSSLLGSAATAKSTHTNSALFNSGAIFMPSQPTTATTTMTTMTMTNQPTSRNLNTSSSTSSLLSFKQKAMLNQQAEIALIKSGTLKNTTMPVTGTPTTNTTGAGQINSVSPTKKGTTTTTTTTTSSHLLFNSGSLSHLSTAKSHQQNNYSDKDKDKYNQSFKQIINRSITQLSNLNLQHHSQTDLINNINGVIEELNNLKLKVNSERNVVNNKVNGGGGAGQYNHRPTNMLVSFQNQELFQ